MLEYSGRSRYLIEYYPYRHSLVYIHPPGWAMWGSRIRKACVPGSLNSFFLLHNAWAWPQCMLARLKRICGHDVFQGSRDLIYVRRSLHQTCLMLWFLSTEYVMANNAGLQYCMSPMRKPHASHIPVLHSLRAAWPRE